MFPRFQLKKKNPVYQESKRTKTVVQLRIRKKRKKKEEETKAKSEQKKKKNRKEGKGKRGKHIQRRVPGASVLATLFKHHGPPPFFNLTKSNPASLAALSPGFVQAPASGHGRVAEMEN